MAFKPRDFFKVPWFTTGASDSAFSMVSLPIMVSLYSIAGALNIMVIVVMNASTFPLYMPNVRYATGTLALLNFLSIVLAILYGNHVLVICGVIFNILNALLELFTCAVFWSTKNDGIFIDVPVYKAIRACVTVYVFFLILGSIRYFLVSLGLVWATRLWGSNWDIHEPVVPQMTKGANSVSLVIT